MSLKGFAFGKMFLIFLIGSILGAYYEELLNIATQIINHQKVVYEYRRGIIYGPFSPIYGMGTVIMTLVLCKKERTLRKTFLLAAIVGGIIEYLISFLQETFIGTISWDYSDKLLNINGRTTIPYMAFWGLLGVIFVKYIYPPLSSFIENIPDTIGQCLVTLLFVLFITALFNKDIKEFAYKVFEYLWDDVMKISKDTMFKNSKSLDELINTYVEKGQANKGEEVFVDNFFKTN